MKKIIKDKLYIVVFLLIITLPLVNLLFYDNEGNNIEKRSKINKPKIKECKNINEYIKNYELYFNDNFGFRSNLILLNSKIDLNIFKQTPNKDVILGKNDYLYYKHTLQDYNRENTMSISDIEKITSKLKYFQDSLKNDNIEFLIAIAPNKNTIYPEFMPRKSKNIEKKSNLEVLQESFQNVGVNYLDFAQLMKENKTTQSMYYKNDTHWNKVAANIAANEILAYFNNKFNTKHSLESINLREEEYNGDLQNFLGFYSPKLEITSDYKLTLEGAKLPKTLIYGDSFGGTMYAPLNDAFSDIKTFHILEERIKTNFVDNIENTSIVIIEIVERNLPILLDYDFDVFEKR